MMFLRPAIIRLIPAAFIGLFWTANIVLAHLLGRRILSESKKEREEKDGRSDRHQDA